MKLRPCPVCSAPAASGSEWCSVCGFDLRPLLDSSPQAQAAWQERIRAAQAWRAQEREPPLSPSPSLAPPSPLAPKEPDLTFVLKERDPFETHQEFAERRESGFKRWNAALQKEAFYAGQVTLVHPEPPRGPLQTWQVKLREWPRWAEQVGVTSLDFSTILEAQEAAEITGSGAPSLEMWINLCAQTTSQFSVTSACLRAGERQLPLFRGPIHERYTRILSSKRWKIGEVRLQKAEYNVETGKFPMTWERTEGWLESKGASLPPLHTQLARDPARTLYEKAQHWDLYADLFVCGKDLQVAGVFLYPQSSELPDAIQLHLAPPSQASMPAHFRSLELSSKQPSHNVEGFVWLPSGILYMRPSNALKASGFAICVERKEPLEVTERACIRNAQEGSVSKNLPPFVLLTKGFWIKKEPVKILKTDWPKTINSVMEAALAVFLGIFLCSLIYVLFFGAPRWVTSAVVGVTGVLVGRAAAEGGADSEMAAIFAGALLVIAVVLWNDIGRILGFLFFPSMLLVLLILGRKNFVEATRPTKVYDEDAAVLYCNELSLREGLAAAYRKGLGKGGWEVVLGSSGYRLLTAEWEFLVGGKLSPEQQGVYLFRAES